MLINLTKIPVYWNTIEKNVDRHQKMQSMFNNIGISNAVQLNGEIVKPYTIGIAKSHIESLSAKIPVLVLEDDCQTTEHYNSILTVPDDADAVYLGTSHYGMIRGKTVGGGTISSIYDENYLRVYNMLGLHSVLYLSEKYRNHVVNTLNEFVQNPVGGCDDPIAMTMKKYNVYAVKNPMFYQNDGHSEAATITPLIPFF